MHKPLRGLNFWSENGRGKCTKLDTNSDITGGCMVNYKKSLTVILIFVFHFSCFHSAFASTANLGGWTINSKVAQGASTLINASKTVVINGANIAKTSTAIIKPAVPQVTKLLLRGAGGYALSIAVEQLIGAVDWILDPANSRIVYHETNDPQKPDPTSPVIFARLGGYATLCNRNYNVQNFASLKTDASSCFSTTGKKGDVTSVETSGQTVFVYISSENGLDVAIYNTLPNPIYDPNAHPEKEEKSIPLDTVAQKIIDNAESGDADSKVPSQTVTVGAVEDALSNDSATQSNVRNQLETNSKTQTNEDAKGDTKPKDPTAPELGDELSLKFPVFCSWAPMVCEAAQVAISFPQTLTSWWDFAKEHYQAALTSISDFFKDESNTDTELEFKDPTQITDTSISFSNQCPAPIVLADFSYHGISQHWKMDFSQWCDVLSTIIKPIVIAMASLSAVLIVSGVRENG